MTKPCLSTADLGLFRSKTVLVTGAAGFVASHLIPRLRELGALVTGLDLRCPPAASPEKWISCDLNDGDTLGHALGQRRPDFVFHLASQASVGTSWGAEMETIERNVRGTFHLLSWLERNHIRAKLLLVSSGEVYGDCGGEPADESSPLRPRNPYAVSKAMMEVLSHRFATQSLEVVIARAFNHTGPGRPPQYFEAMVARRLADAALAGQHAITLRVGSIDNVRDFSDVRDVVEKYILLAGSPGGGVYNVCSGRSVSLREVIHVLANISGIQPEVVVDPKRIRANDVRFLVGRNRLPVVDRPLESTLADLFAAMVGTPDAE